MIKTELTNALIYIPHFGGWHTRGQDPGLLVFMEMITKTGLYGSGSESTPKKISKEASLFFIAQRVNFGTDI